MKNIHYSNHTLIIEGDNLFKENRFEEALSKFQEYLDLQPTFRKFVLGRIGITELKLCNFEKAKNYITEAIILTEERDKEYCVILAECYYGLKWYNHAFNYCNKYIDKYGRSKEIELILEKVLPTSEYSILLENNDLDYNEISCANALLKISEKYFLNEEYDEAEYYANMRINYSDLNAIDGYYLLGSIFSKAQEYYKCAGLIDKLKQSKISEREKSAAYSFLLEIYKKSLCYPLSELSQQDLKLSGFIDLVSKIKEEISVKKMKTIFSNYRPSLNLPVHFDLEASFQLARD